MACVNRLCAFVIVVCSVACCSTKEPNDTGNEYADQGRGSISTEAEKWLRVLEDLAQEPSVRADAADALGKLGDKRVVDRLLQVPLGDVDVVTYKVVVALGRLGDRKAIPVLKGLLKKDLLGKIRFQVELAIKRCSQ